MSENPGDNPAKSRMAETDPAIIDTQIATGLIAEKVTDFIGNFLVIYRAGFIEELLSEMDGPMSQL